MLTIKLALLLTVHPTVSSGGWFEPNDLDGIDWGGLFIIDDIDPEELGCWEIIDEL